MNHIKSDNYCYRKVGQSMRIWGLGRNREKSNIAITILKNKQIVNKNAPISFLPYYIILTRLNIQRDITFFQVIDA